MSILSQSDVWLGVTRLVIILFTLALVWITYQSHLVLKRFQPDFNLLLSPPENLVRVALVGVCLFLAWLSGLPPEQLGLVINDPRRQIGLGLAAAFIIQIGANGVMIAAIRILGSQVYSPLVIRNIMPRRRLEWVLVPLAFIPAVFMEELLFRTLWVGVFTPVVWLPVLLVSTSIFFGIMHLPQGVLGAVLAGIMNIFLSLLFLWTGSFLAPLIAHYTINVSQVVLARFGADWLENY